MRKTAIANLVESAKKYQMNSNFERIKEGKELDINNKPYEVKMLDAMINFFAEDEKYEECQLIVNFKTKTLEHESNYIIKEEV
jgi:uncharacterized protein YeeX (DUF496 family)